MKKTGFSRREFLQIAGVLCWACPRQGWAEEKQERPNIIFLLTDDQRAGTLGSSGNPVIKTPNLDALAAEGVRFTRAFVAEPICAPSRTTYFTGQYERVHQVGFSSAHKLTEGQWEGTYPALLRKSGYYTGFIGKFGVENYVFRGKAADKFDFWRAHDGWAAFFPKPQKNCAIYRDAKKDIITPIMADSIERFLDTLPGEKPFCLSVSFSAPHGSISGTMYPNERGDTRMTHPANENPKITNHPIYGSLYRDKEMEIPSTVEKDPGKYIPAEVLDQSMRKQTYSYDYHKKTCREHYYRYYQLITGVDAVVGQMRESLKKRGLDKNTVIMFTSDHGLLMGEYGMGGKGLLYDLATRVPLILYDGRMSRDNRAKQIEELVISTDIAPTILSLAGVKLPKGMQGKNLMELVQQPEKNGREDIFLESLYVGRHNPLIEGVRSKKWKYIRFFENPGRVGEGIVAHYGRYIDKDVDFRGKEPILEQLFDLEYDAKEVNNLAGKPQYKEVLKKLQDKCESYSREMIKQREENKQRYGFEKGTSS